MARLPQIKLEVHHCPLIEIYSEKANLPAGRNGDQPRIPLPLMRVADGSWYFPLGENDILIPIRYCPYCGEDMDG